MSLDYDAQEYKLMACLSRDSLMLSNFHNGIDPHTASAYAIWGEENYNKAKGDYHKYRTRLRSIPYYILWEALARLPIRGISMVR